MNIFVAVAVCLFVCLDAFFCLVLFGLVFVPTDFSDQIRSGQTGQIVCPYFILGWLLLLISEDHLLSSKVIE